jgi:hypothetical protein
MIDPWFANGQFVLHIGNVFAYCLEICFVQSIQPFAHRFAARGRTVEDCRYFSARRHRLMCTLKSTFLGIAVSDCLTGLEVAWVGLTETKLKRKAPR